MKCIVRSRRGGGQFSEDFEQMAFYIRDWLVHDKPSFVDDDDSCADVFDFVKQMGGDENGLFASHLLDHAAHFIFLIGIEPVRRFIQQEGGRIMDKGLRKTGAVGISFGEGSDDLPSDGLQLATIQRVVNGLFAFRLRSVLPSPRVSAQKDRKSSTVISW